METLDLITPFLAVNIGSGDGYGDGSGYGSGITRFCGQQVHNIDSTPTIIHSVHRLPHPSGTPREGRGQNDLPEAYARASILNSDFTLTPCYVAKVEGRYFAHADTLRQALAEAQKKAMQDKPLSERIQAFRSSFPDPDKPVPAADLFQWHNTLTGSCQLGRESFCRDHGIDLNADYTVRYFLNLCRNAYGSNAIRQLADAYAITLP